MSTKKIGYALLFLSTTGIVVSLLGDLIGLGRGGIQAAQIFVIEVGILFLLCGVYFGFILQETIFQPKSQTYFVLRKITDIPSSVWVIFGFAIAFLLFFIFPMFFHPSLRMQYFLRYIPDRFPIGNDLTAMTSLIAGWFEKGQSPYPSQFYPPLTYVFFAPLLLVGFPATYKLITIVTLISYILTIFLVVLISPKKKYSLVMLFGITGLLSYGFQFELERGQYNVIAFLFCLLAIYVFHYHYEFRHIAYLLFTLSIQLKIYPAIFIVFFIRDWRDWKSNLQRISGLGLLNFSLLFIMGYQVFIDFLNSVSIQIQSPTGWNWNGNHSIKAFVFGVTRHGSGIVTSDIAIRLEPYSSVIESILLGVFALCFFSVILFLFINKESSLNPHLLLICSIGALIVPISNDYKLPVLVAPMAILSSNLADMQSTWKKSFSILLILISSTAYAITLFPFKYKPEYLSNTFPLLFVILISVTLLFFLQYEKQDVSVTNK